MMLLLTRLRKLATSDLANMSGQKEEEEVLEVEKLVTARRTKDRIELLVAWKGYDSSENSWEMYGNLGEAGQAMIPELKQRMGDDYPDKRISQKSPKQKKSPGLRADKTKRFRAARSP